MTESRKSRASGNWRLSALWRPLSIEVPFGSSPWDSADEASTAHWSTGEPSIEPRTFSRLGAISPTTGLTSGAYAFRDSEDRTHWSAQHKHSDSTDPEAYAGRYAVARPEKAYAAHGQDVKDNRVEEDSAETDEEEEFGASDEKRSFDQMDAEEEGVLGLVHRRPSKRHSSGLTRQPSAARSLIDKLSIERRSSRKESRERSRKLRRQGSRVLSALPPLPDSLRSGQGTPEKGSQEIKPDHHMSQSQASTRPTSERHGSAPPLPEKHMLRYQPTPLSGPPSGPPSSATGGPPGGPRPTTSSDPNLVLWNGPSDRGNPMNWSRKKKWGCTFALGSVTFCVTLASSIFSPANQQAAQHFGVSSELMILATALYVLGFAFGPIVWGPLSELYGRKMPLFAGFIVFALFQIPVGMAQNIQTIFICRFIGGVFGSAPLAITGGAFADFWMPVDRGIAVSIFSCATFLGPTLGPVIGGCLVETPGLGWRWTAWITLVLCVVFGVSGWLLYPESFGPVLLQQRAKRLRFATKNWAIHAPSDEIEVTMTAILEKYLTKPIMMLVWEPILLLITIYISFIYGILYLFFEAFPLSYIEQRGWSPGNAGLPFLAIMGGVLLSVVVNLVFIKKRYVRILRERGNVPPEERLLPMMVGSVALPAGLFLHAWTSPLKTPIPQIVSGVPIGLGICLIFIQGINYIVDVYMMYANSALAGNTIPRSLFGATFPLFATYMYRSLGVEWATAILGFIAVGLIPVPILFFIFGARIRKLSKYTPKFPPGMGPGGPGGPGGPPPMMAPAAAGPLPTMTMTAPPIADVPAPPKTIFRQATLEKLSSRDGQS